MQSGRKIIAAQNGKLENALWSAVRLLMERAALHQQMADRSAGRGMNSAAERYQERAHQEEKNAKVIRDVLASQPVSAEPMPAADDQMVQEVLGASAGV